MAAKCKEIIAIIIMTGIFYAILFFLFSKFHSGNRIADGGAEDYSECDKIIALTFDDGPGPYTGSLLDGLAERGAAATFFMTGRNGNDGIFGIENVHSDILRRMWEDGHQLANHTWSHAALQDLSNEEIASEVADVSNLLFEITGGEYKVMVRTPGGHTEKNVLAAVKAPVILWTLDTLDYETRDADDLYQTIMEEARPGDILLMHDIYPTTVEGALRAIDDLKKDGYEFVTVAELLRRCGTEPTEGEYYSNNIGIPDKGIGAYLMPEIELSEDGLTVQSCISQDGLCMYYTLDGSYPDLSGTVFEGEVCLAPGQVFMAVGIDEYGTRTPAVRIIAGEFAGAQK